MFSTSFYLSTSSSLFSGNLKTHNQHAHFYFIQQLTFMSVDYMQLYPLNKPNFVDVKYQYAPSGTDKVGI